MTTITIDRALLEQALALLSAPNHRIFSEPKICLNLRAALSAPATAPKHRTVSDDLIACLRGGRQCDADGVEVIMSRQACREAADILESWAIDQAPATAPSQPAWQDAPTVPGLWLAKSSGIVRLVDEHDIEHLQKYGLPRWFGPIPEDK